MKLNATLIISFTILIGLFQTGCGILGPVKRERPAINHVVLLWLKEDVSEAVVRRIIEETEKLEEISEVENLNIGRSMPSDRKIVDDSFDIGIHMVFSSRDAMLKYLRDKQHVHFVNKWIKPNIQKIVVYDF